MLFNRCWQLKIHFIETGKVKIYQKLTTEDVGLSLSFQCEMTTNSSPAGGQFTIRNLTESDLAYLGASFRPGAGQLKPAQVEFSAGYDNTLSLIIIGNVFQTTLNYEESDRSITMTVMNGIQINQLNIFASVSMQGNTTLRDILANLANRMKIPLKIDPKLQNLTVGDYSFQGSPLQQLDALRKQHPDINFTVTNDTLEVSHKEAPPGEVRYKITANSGLLGTPTPTPTGVIITTYLLSNLNINEFIELETIRLPQLNGIYRIMKINHQGDSRGDNWRSTLTCVYPSF